MEKIRVKMPRRICVKLAGGKKIEIPKGESDQPVAVVEDAYFKASGGLFFGKLPAAPTKLVEVEDGEGDKDTPEEQEAEGSEVGAAEEIIGGDEAEGESVDTETTPAEETEAAPVKTTSRRRGRKSRK